jgi:glycosyltransferase involved in cell wall biosynthesis
MRVPDGPRRARIKFQATHRRLERQAREILLRHHIELVHVQCVSANGYYARRVGRRLGLPIVVTSQGERTMDAGNAFARSAFLNDTLRGLLDSADFVTACSRDTLHDLEGYIGESFGSRAEVIYNGVSTEDFDIDAGVPYQHPSPYVLGIGRLVPQKGFDVLLRAFAEAVRRDGFGQDLLLAGDGSERRRLEAIVDDLGLQGRVHLIGPADRALAVSLLNGCSFAVVPSRSEPLGIVTLEAMAAGKAVIASAVGGIPEIVRHEHNGLLVSAEDVQELAAALTRLASDEQLAKRLSEAGRTFVSAFTWPKIADQYEAVYASVQSTHGLPRSLRGAD